MKNTLYTPTIILMAIAAGICTGSNYFSQPLIHSMSQNLQLPETIVSWVPTLAQIAYACGLLLLMPLGDILEKRRLLFCFMLFAALGLIISGISEHISLLILGTLITGLFSVAAQLLLPLAASLVPAQQSGRVVGFLLSGLMMGGASCPFPFRFGLKFIRMELYLSGQWYFTFLYCFYITSKYRGFPTYQH